MSKTKQVIVMRKDLPGTKGKMCAQASHASIAFLTRHLSEDKLTWDYEDGGGVYSDIELSGAERDWLKSSFVKVVVGVDSEEELLEIYEAAKAAGLTAHLVTDSGYTVFHGVPTKTCIAIGPDYSDRIDPITAHLRLL